MSTAEFGWQLKGCHENEKLGSMRKVTQLGTSENLKARSNATPCKAKQMVTDLEVILIAGRADVA
jgi:hypothetical protein